MAFCFKFIDHKPFRLKSDSQAFLKERKTSIFQAKRIWIILHAVVRPKETRPADAFGITLYKRFRRTHTYTYITWAAIRLTDWNFESINTNLYPMHGNIFCLVLATVSRRRIAKNPNHTFFSCNFCVCVCVLWTWIYLYMGVSVWNWIQSQLKYVLFMHVYCMYRIVHVTLMNTRYQFISCFFFVVVVAAVFASLAP